MQASALINTVKSFLTDRLTIGSLRGRIASTKGTTTTNSTNTTQPSIFEDVLQILRASQSAPPSFQRQTSVLRILYTSLHQSRDVDVKIMWISGSNDDQMGDT